MINIFFKFIREGYKLSLVFFLLHSNYSFEALSYPRICKIKYGENGIDRQTKNENRDARGIILNDFECNQIGVEHDINKKPNPDLPIYSCCK